MSDDLKNAYFLLGQYHTLNESLDQIRESFTRLNPFPLNEDILKMTISASMALDSVISVLKFEIEYMEKNQS